VGRGYAEIGRGNREVAGSVKRSRRIKEAKNEMFDEGFAEFGEPPVSQEIRGAKSTGR